MVVVHIYIYSFRYCKSVLRCGVYRASPPPRFLRHDKRGTMQQSFSTEHLKQIMHGSLGGSYSLCVSIQFIFETPLQLFFLGVSSVSLKLKKRVVRVGVGRGVNLIIYYRFSVQILLCNWAKATKLQASHTRYHAAGARRAAAGGKADCRCHQ